MLNVGLIGVGNISPAYIKGCRAYDTLQLLACADIDVEKAHRVAAENQIPKAYTVDELLADPEIDLVINLTIPNTHAQVSTAILNAGKHAYSEKPLATSLQDAQALMKLSAERNLLVGCAPDTFLFAQHQTARKLLDEGVIGTPVAGVAFMANHGPEKWHPNPDFFYQPGGGPMFDMGPYYMTCLVNLLGPAVRVTGNAHATFPQRTAGDGHTVAVNVPTHYSGVVEFASGTLVTVMMSFDIWKHHLPQMEIYGTIGTMTIPDPNGYDPRDVRLFVPDQHDWTPMPLVYPESWARGIGVADMARSIVEKRPHRASGALAYHVLEIMQAFERSQTSGGVIELQSRCERPAAMPLNIDVRTLAPML